MKHVNYFEDFLREKVNLNQHRLDILEQRLESITNLLKSKLLGYRKYSPQGSYAHKTIIKPVDKNNEFDVDILVLIKDNNFRSDEFQENYVRNIHSVLVDNRNYKDIVSLCTRCVTIDYAGDFHVDVVPCIEHQENFYVCNRKEKRYEQTDGDGYRRWLVEKNRITGGNLARKVTRLLKFQRDHKRNYSTKSILLTALIGNHIYDSDKGSEEFKDLPQALKTLSNRINDFLQCHPQMPIIKNPVLPEEDFNRNWDQVKYNNFRKKFELYNTKINKAFEEKNHNKSVKLWWEVFGDDFGELEQERTFVPPVHAQKPYASQDTRPLKVIGYSDTEMKKVQHYIPS